MNDEVTLTLSPRVSQEINSERRCIWRAISPADAITASTILNQERMSASLQLCGLALLATLVPGTQQLVLTAVLGAVVMSVRAGSTAKRLDSALRTGMLDDHTVAQRLVNDSPRTTGKGFRHPHS